MMWAGIVATGNQLVSTVEQLPEPYVPGSLNLVPTDTPMADLVADSPHGFTFEHGDPTVTPVTIIEPGPGDLEAVALNWHDDFTDLIASVHLRTELNLADGDLVLLEIPEEHLR